MTSNQVPAPRRQPAGPAIRRAASDPAVREPQAPSKVAGSRPPVHDGGALGFVDLPGREYWWDQLGVNVRDRMIARVGQIVEWWAYCDRTETRRPYAVVFGERGLAVCTPTVNDRGGPAQLLTVVPFVPLSLRHAIVVQKPRRPGSGRPPIEGGATVPATTDIPLPAHMRKFLGNLPAEAQSRLQWPFVNGDVLDRGDYHYSGSHDALDVWCYLAGRQSVTFVSGHGTGLSGPADRASWRLICRQAEVAVR
jgi:hypothetical protein